MSESEPREEVHYERGAEAWIFDSSQGLTGQLDNVETGGGATSELRKMHDVSLSGLRRAGHHF